ncbi:protein of unknown function (plasmid) [Paraburkholderia dioscoreae]|uniref:Uncharacterized protein n=1 Tax=Paraburkholderia dioscoreae TaxID=2604047 RepID=A0A5Q4ZEI2_9BURK|nr:protein of unknown function [Paraburkholderia dioscoreae]
MFRLRNNRSKPARMQVALKQATPARDGDWLFVIQDTQADQREKAARDARGAALNRASRDASQDLHRSYERLTTGRRILGGAVSDVIPDGRCPNGVFHIALFRVQCMDLLLQAWHPFE